MEMTLRWYGSGFDTVTLRQIRQIPGVTGVITTWKRHAGLVLLAFCIACLLSWRIRKIQPCALLTGE